MKSIRWLFVFLFLTFNAPVLAERGRPLVFADQYVVYAEGEFCPWNPGVRQCRHVYGPGVHLFSTTNKNEVVPYDAEKEAKDCNRITGGISAKCSSNASYGISNIDDDPLRAQQWHISKIAAEKAWEKTGGSATGHNIAVLDTGVDGSHPDLFVTDGYDSIKNSPIKGQASADPNGHGTHVAGIACGLRGNGVGIAGISKCSIVPVRVLGASGGGSLFTVMRGLNWVVYHRAAKVINMSLGAGVESPGFQKIIDKAVDAGLIVVAAAGNSGRNLKKSPEYPCKYEGVICVGATDQAGKRARFSNYGPGVGVTAPGVEILSTWPGGAYLPLNGTSMATPIVAGAIALTGKIPQGKLNLAALAGVDPCSREKLKQCKKRRKCRLKRKPERRQCRKFCKSKANCGVKHYGNR